MSKRQPKGLLGGEELRTGASGVPLALAPELYRKVIINGGQPKKTAAAMGISSDVAFRMLTLMKRHRVPSTDRLIVLSLGYPDRTLADIAAAFHVTVDYVIDCAARMSAIRKAEPLSTELWEDVTEKTMMQDEVQARAAEVRRRNELDQREVPGGSVGCPQGGASLGRNGQGKRGRRGPRHEARPAGAQSAERLVPHPGRSRLRSA
jgi:hypothetical protein